MCRIRQQAMAGMARHMLCMYRDGSCRWARLVLVLVLLWPVSLFASSEPARQLEPAQMQQWVEEMKSHPRGPFLRIRWFCADGTILPPVPYACREHGGGRQHGEWNAQVLAIREQGYWLATVLAALDPLSFAEPEGRWEELAQLLLERFLIQFDDGWVFRQARYYRGAIQAEDEQDAALRLLLALIEVHGADPTRYLLLREAARLLPLGYQGLAAERVRHLALEIAERDPGFHDLRVKLHGMPDAGDAQRVRDYAQVRGLAELADDYRTLATLLDDLYTPQATVHRLKQLEAKGGGRVFRAILRQAIIEMEATADDLPAQLQISARLSRHWRDRFMDGAGLSSRDRLALLQAGLLLEQEIYALGNRLAEEQGQADRLSSLQWLESLSAALYASGLLSTRQLHHLEGHFGQLTQTMKHPVEMYAAELRYLARVAQWGQRALDFHFAAMISRWQDLTPLAAQYIPDRLRASPMLPYTRLLDTLLEDANRQAGVRHSLFGEELSSGLRALNPGLRRGVLLPPPDDGLAAFRKDGIYLLPATTPELPPVSGILTRDEGSSLSHVQLLARNLAIPNVVVEERLLPRLEPWLGERVVLAASPAGRVVLAADGTEWDAILGAETVAAGVVIVPDLDRLDLHSKVLRPLHDLRADDSGRTVGPKAANLGELSHYYPQQVSRGVAIPFGAFRELLEQPFDAPGRSAFAWLQDEYRRLGQIGDRQQRQVETAAMLARLREWIVSTDPGPEFRARLHLALEEQFGSADTSGVFVRSDTNVEDLPGFSGAGLNRTIANVVGFEAIVQAIQQVWASPFSERAHAWRQAHMSQPEHVYAAVLLQETVPVAMSGVMATADIDSGDRLWLSIAVSEGLGGVVDGQAAEELRVHRRSGALQLLAQASASTRREALPQGGIRRVPASGRHTLLGAEAIAQLRELADDVLQHFPIPSSPYGVPAIMDIEFGFYQGRLFLFQIRPIVENPHTRFSHYLSELDHARPGIADGVVDLRQGAEAP